MPRLALVLTLLLTAGCAGDGSELDLGEPPGGPEPTLAYIQENVFGAICINCHVPGGPGEFMLLDSEEHSYENLVNVSAIEQPLFPDAILNRVTPGDPAMSYLVWKVEGQGPNGELIQGDRMPPPTEAPALPAETIALIKQWIADGAQP